MSHPSASLADGSLPRPPLVVGIVGAGLMGAGIAQVAAVAGHTVRLTDVAPGAAEAAREAIAARLAAARDRGRISAELASDALERVSAVDDLASLADAAIVVEAVIEDLAIKRELFAHVEEVVTDDAILASNTSSLPITHIAGRTRNAARVIGTHFFSPVPAMALCEIVRGSATSDATVARTVAFVESLGKEPIVVSRDDPGFVTSRLITVLTQEAARIVESGLATPEDVDRACVLAFGHALGPLATLDLTGIDVAVNAGAAIREASGDPRFEPPFLLKRMVAAGRLGRKSGRGFFDYDREVSRG
ncbi:3-hydroxyacyl-CoA dehydrogenase family protein [Microbacterium sp. SORGH_AS_0888]|uniref:3-hydroxyacyl-CoA dehydrogenase family protein n=1 Tax=Microbacterium sp. SORGH_AS_0888 TaxID=3041791 RepID=UPI002783A03A|nr:3-hydroxyacyl-CoA dehydrogenase family protein [Microbacterium sp. SORGH_AS_0888]MDQ1131015.1 3-hydroxybutyryl-CoA dehydrogenase [Microbacterium sp. SORGH_AS_0888]